MNWIIISIMLAQGISGERVARLLTLCGPVTCGADDSERALLTVGTSSDGLTVPLTHPFIIFSDYRLTYRFCIFTSLRTLHQMAMMLTYLAGAKTQNAHDSTPPFHALAHSSIPLSLPRGGKRQSMAACFFPSCPP